MANTTAIQILQDGPRNVIVKVTGTVDTADQAVTTLIDPSALSFIDNYNNRLATQLAIREVEFSVSDTISVVLWWDATTDVQALTLTQSDQLCFDQPLQNNAGAGKTGIINYSTYGWKTGVLAAYTVVLDLVKQTSIA